MLLVSGFKNILHKMLTPFFKELPNSFYFSKTWIMLTKQNHDQINTKYSQLFNKYYRILKLQGTENSTRGTKPYAKVTDQNPKCF